MKKILKLLLAFSLVVMLVCASACGNVSPDIGSKDEKRNSLIEITPGGDYAGGGDRAPESIGKPSSDGSDLSDDGSSEPGGKENVTIKPGQMTAGAHNDNDYYSDYLKLFESGQTPEENGKFTVYETGYFGLNTLNRVKVTVKNGQSPVYNASVSCKVGDKTVFEAVTDAKGVAYLFPRATSGEVTVIVFNGNKASVKTELFTETERELAFDFSDAANEKSKLIQLMFVIDATGSMGDEINYLKAELGDVIKRVVKNNANDVEIQLSFLFYRDDCDDEKFAFIRFKDVTDPKNYEFMQNVLSSQRATGGGDAPEALDEALLIAANAEWSDQGTKIIFNLLDAPCHETESAKINYSKAVTTAAAKGIRICPILASGADKFTEYLTRQAAVMTGGTFAFITDDSGIGGSHYSPDIPNVVIEHLNDMLVRLIDGYYTGVFEAPVYWKDAVAGQ